MKTKSKSTHVYEIRLWSKKHYKEKTLKPTNIFEDAQITDIKTGEHIFVKTVAEFLTVIERMYRKAEE